jgi:hypothetical protein
MSKDLIQAIFGEKNFPDKVVRLSDMPGIAPSGYLVLLIFMN